MTCREVVDAFWGLLAASAVLLVAFALCRCGTDMVGMETVSFVFQLLFTLSFAAAALSVAVVSADVYRRPRQR